MTTASTELLEAISRWPARDAYEMEVKQTAQRWAYEVIADNHRLRESNARMRETLEELAKYG